MYYRQSLRCFILFINGGKVLNLMLLPLLSLITLSHVTDFSGGYAQKENSKICSSQWVADQGNASKNGSRMESYKPLPPFSQKIIWLKKGVSSIFPVMSKSFVYMLLMSVAKLQVLLIAQALNMHLVNMGGGNTMGGLDLFHDTGLSTQADGRGLAKVCFTSWVRKTHFPMCVSALRMT